MDEWFRSDAGCRDYIHRLRWPDGFACPHCRWTGEPWVTSRGLLHCRGCQGQTSLTAGTVFEGTRKPLRMWFLAMWFVTSQKNGVSALGLQRVLGLGSYETAWTWLHKLRRAMVRPGRDCLTGAVEVDETRRPRRGKAGPGSRNKGHRRGGPRRGVAASAGSAFGASRTCPRTAFFPSSRMPCRPGRWSIPTDGVVIAGWRRPATSTKSLSSATARNRPMRSCRESTPLLRFSSGGCSAPTRAAFAPASRLLPRRIHLPVQSTALTSPGAALPQTRPTGCRCRTDPLPHHHRSCRFRSPDSGTGVKGIPSFA